MDDIQKTLTTLPHAPGVYTFFDENNVILYVGKAKDLSRRVHQYFVAPGRLGEKTQQLVARIKHIEVQTVASEFDALLLEAKRIRHFAPKYNIIEKDDKSPIYIRIGKKELLPIVKLARKPKTEDEKIAWYFGPFSSTRIARDILKTLRRSVPFCMQKISKRPCFYTHLSLCNPCPSVIQATEEGDKKKEMTGIYRGNIRRLKAILSGKSNTVIHGMEREIKTLANKEQFEKAGALQKQYGHLLQTLETHYDPFQFEEEDPLIKLPEEQLERLKTVLTKFFSDLPTLSRIECYDISNTGGTDATGSMVVVVDGIPDTREYRKFRIKTKHTPDDPGMMHEVLSRRLTHSEWPYPNLIIVDGGKTEINAVRQTVTEAKKSIPVIGITKRRETLIIPTGTTFRNLELPLHDPALHIIERIRDEAHRFAITYHRKLRSKAFHA